MKWLRCFCLLVILATVGCSGSPAPKLMEDEAGAAEEVDVSAEAEALAE